VDHLEEDWNQKVVLVETTLVFLHHLLTSSQMLLELALIWMDLLEDGIDQFHRQSCRLAAGVERVNGLLEVHRQLDNQK
jgi:hypothetical protein